MDQIAKQAFAEEGNFRIADHHQIGQNFGQLAIDQDPHDEGEIGSEEVGLGDTIQGPLAGNRRNEHRATVPINIVLSYNHSPWTEYLLLISFCRFLCI